METHDQQRRTLLRRTLFGACALAIPALFGGCNRDNNSNTGKGSSGETSGENASGGGNDTGMNKDKVSKEEAKYQDRPKGDQQCSKCAHFIAQSNTCERVDGKVDPHGWCTLWTKKV
jgi:hypothetical protein